MPVATQIKIHLIDFIVFGFVLNILSKLHQGQTTNRKKKTGIVVHNTKLLSASIENIK